MILKEAFRYSNHLSELLSTVMVHLSITRNTTVTTSEHMRSKAHADAVDEILDNKGDRTTDVPANVVIDLGMAIVREKEQLTAAIDAAKAADCPSVDSDIAMNRVRRKFIDGLRLMTKLRNTERMTYGTGYCFNVEGIQVPYRYDIKETTTIDFDRDKVRKLIDLLTEESDAASNHADLSMNTVEVDFTPRFSINDSFEDVIEAFKPAE